MASMSVIGGVAKKIALFEFAPPENNNTINNTNPRLRRKDAIKRKKGKNSPPSTVTGNSRVDLEIGATLFKSTKTLWLSSSGAEESSESYGSSVSSSCTASKGIIKNTRAPYNYSTYKDPPGSTTTTSSSDDYEINEFQSITTRMNENIALVDELVRNKRNDENYFEKQKQSERNSTRSLKDCYQSFSIPILKLGNLKLVEFSDPQLTSGQSPATEEPFYEELDNYSKVGEPLGDGNETESNGFVQGSCTSTKNDEPSVPLISEKDEVNPPGRRCPPTPPPYESLYSELIYEGQVDGKTSSTTSSSSYSLTPNNFSTYNPSLNTSTTQLAPTTDNVYINNMDHTAGKILKNQTSLISQGSSLPSHYNSSSNTSQLPPMTNLSTNPSVSLGNKLSKKFKFLRKLSKYSLDSSDLQLSVKEKAETECIEKRRNSSPSTTTTPVTKTETSNIKKISIARPNIPPPEPPRNPAPLTNISKENLNKSNTDEDYSNDNDSDFYDSDSELIRNFVSAVQPIYSMEEEPLYQYYTYGISLQPEDKYQPVIPKNLGLTLDMLIPRTGQRTLWCEIPEVQTSGILAILSDQQKKLQEAIFEVLTSEVSYIKSLDVLISLFYDNDILVQALSPEERETLFGNITAVKLCSQSFLSELLNKWEESWYIQEVGQIIYKNAKNKFHVYKEYCRNKPLQDKILQKLRNSNDEFVNIVKSIEEDPRCQMLRMDSFLMLPMQRITRLPLLVNAIIQRTQSQKEKSHCEDALKSLTNLVVECNEAARESQDAEETSAIFEKIEFPKNVTSITHPGQFLLKGDFIKHTMEPQGLRGVKMNWSFQKKKRTLHWLILFTNQLFVTRKKSSGKFEVIDMVSPSDASIKSLPNFEGLSKEFQRYFMLQFNRTETIYFLAARTQSEVDRWKHKLDQLKSHKNLKVEAIFLYDAKREDELSFMVGDLIQVSQIQPDGWYFGKKLGTEEAGWFPGNYCAEC